MYHDDHAPPHFHVKYAEYRGRVTIGGLELIEGNLPRRALALVLEWAAVHRSDLWMNWHRAEAGLPLEQIAPLD
jgi:hypothetical protein